MQNTITTLLLAALFLGVSGCDKLGKNADSPAAPREDISALVEFDWVLADGELLQGNEEMEIPQGINVLMRVDNDTADELVVEGYDISFELPAETVHHARFFAFKKGLFALRLKSGGRPLGHIRVVEPQ